MNDQETEDFDTVEKEIEAIDAQLKRLRTLEKLMAQTARPVDAVAAASTHARDPIVTVREAKLPPGIRMARVMRCLGLAQGNRFGAAQLAEQLYKHDPAIAQVLKATVAAGTTQSGNWAEGLVGTETSVFADFVEYLRPMTILGKFGNNGIPSLRTVPFRVALVGQTGGGQGYWVGEGKAKPLTSFDFSRTTLEPLKVANICVLTEELIRDSSPSAETIIRDSLVAALRERLDLDFINPDKVAVAGVSPAGILNGVSPIQSTGNDAESIRRDIAALFNSFIAGNNAPTNGVWVMSASVALTLSLMQNPLGQAEFSGIGMNGGTFAGLPVITSEYVTPNTSGDFIALINASDIYIADEGAFSVDMSREASLEMSDAPAHNSDTPTPAQLVSMFQTNSVAFRAERTINWKRRRSDGVAWLTGVHWGEAST
jgi:HK97 family phage major capsid protein